MSTNPGDEDLKDLGELESKAVNDPPISSDVQRDVSSAQSDETSELSNDHGAGEIGSPLIPSESRVEISPVRRDEVSEITEDQGGGEKNTPLIPTESQREISPVRSDEASEITDDQGGGEISTPLIPSESQREISPVRCDEASEITEDQGGGEKNTPLIPTESQREISPVRSDEASEITDDQGGGEISTPLIPSESQREISPVRCDEASEITEDQGGGEISTPLIPSESQGEISPVRRDEASEITEDQGGGEISTPLIPSESQGEISPVRRDEASEITEDQGGGEISTPLIPSESQGEISPVRSDEASEITEDQGGGEISTPLIPTESQREISPMLGVEASEITEGNDVTPISSKNSRIIEDKIRKPFIGGYIFHPSGTEYHNASANTNFLPQSHINQDRKLERSTQTLWSDSHKSIDTAITAATQTPVRGLHILEPLHIYITPGKLTEIQPIDDKVIKIQRWWRNWLVRKRILIYLEEVKRQDEAWKKELDKVQEEKQKLRAKLQLSVESLRTREDFEHAYYAIELERVRLIKAAQSAYTGNLLNFAYMYILLQEIRLLQKIDNRKRVLSEGKTVQQCHSLLNELSAPRTWISRRDGKPLSMETSVEREFAQWKEIYNNLTETGISPDRRREVLNIAYRMQQSIEQEVFYKQSRDQSTIEKSIPSPGFQSGLSESKPVFQPIHQPDPYNSREREPLEMHDNEDVHHIKDMITQELVLLVLGVDMKKLENFHSIFKRHLFDHLESYALKNRPKIQEFKLSRLKNKLHVCVECGKIKPENSFNANTRTKELIKCKSCVWLENISCKRKDYAIFRHILTSLRKEEARLRCSSPVAFLIQVEDIYYLINSIWHAHSALSQKRTLEDLRLCRFDNSEDWSPWNCILLTHEEMLAHRLVTNTYAVYGECLIKMIQNKHQIAREYFKFLRDVSDRHSRTLEWLNIKKAKPYKYYDINFPNVSYVSQPRKHKLNPSKYRKSGGKCIAEIQNI